MWMSTVRDGVCIFGCLCAVCSVCVQCTVRSVCVQSLCFLFVRSVQCLCFLFVFFFVCAQCAVFVFRACVRGISGGCTVCHCLHPNSVSTNAEHDAFAGDDDQGDDDKDES